MTTIGGNVFKDYIKEKDPMYICARVHRTDYPSVLYAVQAILKDIGLEYLEIDYVREKESHGDLDIIIKKGTLSAHDVTKLLRDKKIITVQTSKDSLSFLLITFQIDLIFVDRESSTYAKNYFSWNDLGNLIGRISKQLGFKHGHDGLFYVHREGDRVIKEYKLSSDYLDILRILQLDITKFENGFDTFNEMFEWISSTPYFNPDIFKFENLNNRNRVRDTKRVVYNKFLSWVDGKVFPDPLIVQDKLNFVMESFPVLVPLYNEQVELLRHSKLLYAKFNGNFVRQWLNLSGKDLGIFLSNFNKCYSKEALMLLNSDEIEAIVRSYYEINYEKQNQYFET